MSKHQKMNCFVLSFSIFMVFIGIVTIAAFAQTPNGTTPAEDSCRGVYGGAFGLCNAFCEASDCDSIDPMDCKKFLFQTARQL